MNAVVNVSKNFEFEIIYAPRHQNNMVRRVSEATGREGCRVSEAVGQVEVGYPGFFCFGFNIYNHYRGKINYNYYSFITKRVKICASSWYCLFIFIAAS